MFGRGAFFDINKKTFPTGLPKLEDVNTKPGFNKRFEDEKDKLVFSPKLEEGATAVYDLEFEKEIGGVQEYGYGFWSRWLQTTPSRVLIKQPWHTLIRLSNQRKYNDMTNNGDRVLAIWVGKGFYHFTTYDQKANQVNIVQNVDYKDQLEGRWNFIYYSYTKQDTPRAVGFVVFGDLDN